MARQQNQLVSLIGPPSVEYMSNMQASEPANVPADRDAAASRLGASLTKSATTLPTRKKRKKRAVITRPEAIRRLRAMLKAIHGDLDIVLASEAALETANAIVKATPGAKRPGAHTYNVVAQSLTLNLAMSLARLFDEGAKRFKPNQRDLASIPLIVRLLRQKRCQDALARAARAWIPHMPSIADQQESACRKAATEAIAAYDAVRQERYRTVWSSTSRRWISAIR